MVINKTFKGLNMITGEQHNPDNIILKSAVVSSILAGSRRVSEKNRQKAVNGQIELLRFHFEAGHQTLEEQNRTLNTIQYIKNEYRRWNMSKGYESYAECRR